MQLKIIEDGAVNIFDIKQGENILAALRSHNIEIDSFCGGTGKCGKCKIKIVEGDAPLSSNEYNFLLQFLSPKEIKNGVRLSCSLYPTYDLTIEILKTQNEIMQTAVDFDILRLEIKTLKKNIKYGIAVDLGTTTIAAVLVDVKNKEIIDKITCVNKQRSFGLDIINRIESANNGHAAQLSSIVKTQIYECALSLCDKNDIDYSALNVIVIAGNTAMLHILFELSCATLGVFPFTPFTLDEIKRDAKELQWNLFNCGVFGMPSISAFIGADISAGLLFSRIYRDQEPSLFIDLGTNGEIALAQNNKIVCAASAAGPAFEGGNVQHGTGGVSGAISECIFNGNDFEIKTIDDKTPIGICGSGLISIISEGLKHGFILESGAFNKEKIKDGRLDLFKNANNEMISLMQKDIRSFQLAKSAICSGIETALDASGISCYDVKNVYLAGGFGAYLKTEYALNVGLLPMGLKNKIKVLGNTALGGAVNYLLDEEAQEDITLIKKYAKEINLQESPFFNDRFLENMSFGKAYEVI